MQFTVAVWERGGDRYEWVPVLSTESRVQAARVFLALERSGKHVAVFDGDGKRVEGSNPYILTIHIRRWDKEDIEDLAGMLTDLDRTATREGFDPSLYVDMRSLPSAPLGIITSDASYPILAMDKKGNVLAGHDGQLVINGLYYVAWRGNPRADLIGDKKRR